MDACDLKAVEAPVVGPITDFRKRACLTLLKIFGLQVAGSPTVVPTGHFLWEHLRILQISFPASSAFVKFTSAYQPSEILFLISLYTRKVPINLLWCWGLKLRPPTLSRPVLIIPGALMRIE